MTELYYSLIQKGQEIQGILHKKEEIKRDEIVKTISKYWIPLESIRDEKKHSVVYQSNIDTLMRTYSGWKKARGDGNCYYRSVITTFILKLLVPPNPIDHLYTFILKLDAAMKSFPEGHKFLSILNELYNFLCNAYHEKRKNPNDTTSFDDFNERLQIEEFDKNIIWVSRILSYLAVASNSYANTFDGFMTDEEKETLLRNINTFGNEAETYELLALPLALGIFVTQINIFEKIVINNYPDEEANANKLNVHIICKSKGHYDCLYPKADHELEQFNIREMNYYFRPVQPQAY